MIVPVWRARGCISSLQTFKGTRIGYGVASQQYDSGVVVTTYGGQLSSKEISGDYVAKVAQTSPKKR